MKTTGMVNAMGGSTSKGHLGVREGFKQERRDPWKRGQSRGLSSCGDGGGGLGVRGLVSQMTGGKCSGV